MSVYHSEVCSMQKHIINTLVRRRNTKKMISCSCLAHIDTTCWYATGIPAGTTRISVYREILLIAKLVNNLLLVLLHCKQFLRSDDFWYDECMFKGGLGFWFVL